MAYWEFLLQKEGDRDWLPLETAHVEISEGRYRIIAHTSYCETPVEIYLSQLLTDQVPPQRKTRKRTGRTTANGLMVVIPYTHLTAGSWTVKCMAASESADSSDRWEYGVQLQVLGIEPGLDYWDSDLEESAPSESIPAGKPSIKRSQPQLPQLTHQTAASPESETITSQSSSQIPSADDAILQQSDPVSTVEDSNRTPQAVSEASTVPPLDAAPIQDLPLRLQLQHQAIVAQQQTVLSLQGQVTTFSQVEGLPSEGTLWVQLRDPGTGLVVHRESRSLSLDSIPSRFNCPVCLPENTTSRLLVGELSLWSVLTPPQVLAIQGFTVTLNLDALLEAVANQGEHSTETTFEDLATGASAPENSEAEDTAADTPQATAQISSPLAHREIPFRRIYLPSTGLTLPPVIYRPVDSKGMGEPSLPLLSNRASRQRAATDSVTARLAKPLSLPPIGNPSRSPRSRQAANPQEEPSAPSLELPPLGLSNPSLPDSDTPFDTADSAVFFAEEEPTQREEPTQETPAKTFQPDFQGRFWSRLSALAHEAQRAAADLKAQMEAAGVEGFSSEPTIDYASEPATDDLSNTAAFNHEVVIYDSSTKGIVPSDLADADFIREAQRSESLNNEEQNQDAGAIPVPQLSLPEGELIAGTSLPITVRLPLYPRRLAVKVWVTDIQSRSLADRPRWLMNWTSTDNGEQTALLNLQVPRGSLEAQFEAIAIDLTSQRESYKTTLVRAIVPPNLPEADFTEPI